MQLKIGRRNNFCGLRQSQKSSWKGGIEFAPDSRYDWNREERKKTPSSAHQDEQSKDVLSISSSAMMLISDFPSLLRRNLC